MRKTPILTQNFNCSLYSDIFPDDWKKARVSPIYKVGKKEECGNYQPINNYTYHKISIWFQGRDFNCFFSAKYDKFLVK